MEAIIKLNKKQKEAIDLLLFDDNCNTLLYGGAAAGGKSWLGCLWLFMLAYRYPNTRYFIARRHKNDLLDSTYPTFLKVVRHYGDSSDYWKLNKQDGILYNKRNGASIAFVATDYEPADPQYNRYGSREYTSGFFEEAQESCRLAYTVLATRVGRCLNDKYQLKSKILLTCNPSRNWLYTDFYKPFITGRLKDNVRVVLASLMDNKANLPQDYLDRMQQIEDPQTRQRLLEGSWDYDDDPQYLIPSKMLGEAIDTASEEGPDVVGIDVGLGGYGADKTVIQRIRGNVIEAPYEIDCGDYTGDPAGYDDWLAGEIAHYLEERGIIDANARFDVSGVGDRVYQILKNKYGHRCYRFQGGLQPIPRRGCTLQFLNLRAQAYWELKEKFRLHKLRLLPEYSEQLFEELVNQKYQQTDKRIAMEDKKYVRQRLGRSPDHADALSMAALALPSHSEKIEITCAGQSRRADMGIFRLPSFGELG